MTQEFLQLLPVAIFSLFDANNETSLRLSFQIIITLSSVALLYFMVRYVGKRALDVALMLRELSIVVLFIRLFVAVAFDYRSLWLTFGSYLFLAVSCLAVLILLINEHRPRIGKISAKGDSLLSDRHDDQRG